MRTRGFVRKHYESAVPSTSSEGWNWKKGAAHYKNRATPRRATLAAPDVPISTLLGYAKLVKIKCSGCNEVLGNESLKLLEKEGSLARYYSRFKCCGDIGSVLE